ncbi:MAG TPA: hypothetical protein VHD56_15305 [Tepidisphaeraceae bacterium]|nr:hypothetical protein [Tepidisphaeraceae bacterium]
MKKKKLNFHFADLYLSVFICGFISISTFGQTTRSGEGLGAIGDDAMLNELATRGLDVLLDRAFEVNHIPESQRQGQKALVALARLADPSAKPTAAQRQQLLAEALAGIDATLAVTNDPNLLMKQAYVLITQGAERDVNTLEYWGENPRTQASLRPVMQTVDRILAKCAERAKSLSEDAAAKITAPNSPFVARYEELERLTATAEYTRRMAAYYLALSMDSASPQRAQIASDAIEYLKQFDVPENPDRCLVRNRMAKLSLLKSDFDVARQLFASVINDSGTPKPTVAQQYEARYFSAVTEILAHNLDGAHKSLNELLSWQPMNLPSDKSSRDGADAAVSMLRYRIASQEAEQTREPAAKAQANKAAVAVLLDLLGRRPDLRGIIYDQLLPKLDDKTDLKQVDPLLLRAMVSKAEQELQKSAPNAVGAATLERGIEAGKEILRRRDQPGVDAQMVDAASLLIPFFQNRLDRKVDAAGGFLDYAETSKQSNLKNATLSLDNAQGIIGSLRADAQTREDSAVTRLYERFLPLAIAAPFKRQEFAFEYARRLQANGDAQRAIEFYRLVPPQDKRWLQATFLQLVALKQQLDDGPADSSQRTKILAETQQLADKVDSAIDSALATAKTDDERNSARSIRVRTLLLAADLARRELKDPQRALSLLNGFEKSVTGLPNADAMVNEAMYIRVQSYMSSEQYTAATDELVKLLNKTEGSQGAQIVYNLLEKLDADFDRAQQANDRPAMLTLARNRAQLSGFLVKWAEQNTEPGIRQYTYRYRVYDADTQRRAAELEDDVNLRQQRMTAALERYQALLTPASVAIYKASLSDPRAKNDPNLYDPQVTLGLALVQYDQGNWEKAAAGFSKLLTARKLGLAVNSIEENGVQKLVDNDPYWEAIYKLVRCDQKLNQGLDEAREFLKLQYVTWGEHVGGKKWKREFEQIRSELIPDFKPSPATTPAQ